MMHSSDPWVTFNPWFQCGASGIAGDFRDVGWSREQIVFVIAGTLFGSMAGWGLVYMAQAVCSRTQLLATLRMSHCIGGLVWFLGPLTCSNFVFVPMCFNTFNWGAEPYDNVLNAKAWRIARQRAAKGDTMHRYWLWSSLVVHVWLVSGAAGLVSGVYLPRTYLFFVFGFKMSHIARLLALDGMDRAASVAEALGVAIVGCVNAISIHDDPWWVSGWFLPLLLERTTHLGSAWHGDASWMRSYDLWDQAQLVLQEADSAGETMVQSETDSESQLVEV